MKIIEATQINSQAWNTFIKENYPPVGSFMQSKAWGAFQKNLNRKVNYFAVMEDKNILALFTLVELKLTFGLRYGYIPRGPVLCKTVSEEKTLEIFKEIKDWSRREYPELLFLRLEPPIHYSPSLRQKSFYFPSYYIQPRWNVVVGLKKSEEEILASFHSSTRSNTKRAEKRGVTVTIKDNITAEDYKAFNGMMSDTIERNDGKNAYPDSKYFHFLLREMPLTAFIAYQDEKAVSVHFVIFFGKTATYIYGASLTAYLSSKADTYLHWTAMKEARNRGFEYYDLGGIDAEKWPGLTTYKRQFKGEEIEYMGIIDFVFKPVSYRIYSFAKYIKAWISRFSLKKK